MPILLKIIDSIGKNGQMIVFPQKNYARPEMHLWDGIVAFEKKRGIFISSDLVFIFGEFHGEIREVSWIKEVDNSGAKEISEKLFLDLLKLKPNFIATGHGPCVSILK